MTQPLKGSTSDWIADRVLRGMIGGLLRLPYPTRVRFMGQILSRGLGPLAGYLRRANDNLALIYPDMPKPERLRIARAVCDNFGRTLIENYSWRDLDGRIAQSSLSGDGLPEIAAAKSAGRPVLFVTGHFGNHEAPRHALTRAGYTIGGLYRPMSNPYFNDHYAKTMTAWGGPVFAQGRKGTMGFARHLKSGGMGTLLFDVSTRNGVQMPFLGHQAWTSTAAADMALRLDALIVPYFGIRRPDGLTFDIRVESSVPHGSATDVMSAITTRLETHVHAHPEQWFWVHRRWK